LGRIVFSRDAARDLDDIFDWSIRERGLAQAETNLKRIEETLERLADLPSMGRIRADLDGAPRSFAVWPWIVLYDPAAIGGGIVVWRVVDGRRDLPFVFRR
jgi:plasmid stabilization system protein ParE